MRRSRSRFTLRRGPRSSPTRAGCHRPEPKLAKPWAGATLRARTVSIALGSYPALAEFCPRGFGTRRMGCDYAVLEDLTGMARPLVVDIKGDARLRRAMDQRITHLAKDRATTTRFARGRCCQTAMLEPDGSSVPVRLGKSWGKGLKPADMPEALRTALRRRPPPPPPSRIHTPTQNLASAQ